MTWDFGTVSSTQPANILCNKFEAALLDCGGYTNIENYQPSATVTNYKHRIWQSTQGFVISFTHRVDGTDNVYLGFSEDYSAASHSLIYPSYSSLNISTSGSGQVRSDYGISTNGWPTTGAAGQTNTQALSTGYSYSYGFNSSRYLSTNTTGFTYAISATAKRVIVATLVSTSTYGWHYLGKFDTMMNGIGGPSNINVEPGSYCAASYSLGNYSNVSLTRSISPSAGLNDSFGWGSYYHNNFTPTYGIPSTYNKIYDGILLSKLYIYRNSSSNSLYSTLNETGHFRGMLDGVVTHTSEANAYSFGDELFVNGSAKYKVINSNFSIEMI